MANFGSDISGRRVSARAKNTVFFHFGIEAAHQISLTPRLPHSAKEGSDRGERSPASLRVEGQATHPGLSLHRGFISPADSFVAVGDAAVAVSIAVVNQMLLPTSFHRCHAYGVVTNRAICLGTRPGGQP